MDTVLEVDEEGDCARAKRASEVARRWSAREACVSYAALRAPSQLTLNSKSDQRHKQRQ